MEHDATLVRTGSVAAFGVAVAYAASGLCAVMMPAELQGRSDISQHQFWLVLSRDPLAHLGFHWSWIVAGLCGLAAVPAISLLVWTAHRGAVLWSGAVAFVGFAVLARILPAPICLLGFAASVTYLAGLLGYTFAVHWLLVVAIGIGGLIVVPAWYASLGFVLWSRARPPA